MRALIFGGRGMLGRAVAEEAGRRGWPVAAPGHAEADVSEAGVVGARVRDFAPQVVFNCAAFTKVDDCETKREHAFAVNGDAVGTIAAAAREAGAALVHVSSDYVFDGAASEPYPEDHATAPLSVYGASKLRGEERALEYDGSLVVRASWLFGPGGPNFVLTMLRLIDQGKVPLRVVDDQVGCPTYTPFLAAALCDLAEKGARGLVHYRNREPVSWCGFAREIATGWDPAVEVQPITTAEYPRPARRPAYSVLAVDRCEALLGRRVESWSDGLSAYIAGLRSGRPERFDRN
ncbi:MAG TPA: dTDP-4-dehydrorhamnose reductase [Thermoanaerobaculia bacterium]|nr:dTDP-4-dehydrorhamnose reductase [Thermoanaerobaculia bacterium]